MPTLVETVTSAAHLLHVSPRTLADPRWRRRWGVPVVRVGGRVRFRREDLEQWLAQRREGNGAAVS